MTEWVLYLRLHAPLHQESRCAYLRKMPLPWWRAATVAVHACSKVAKYMKKNELSVALPLQIIKKNVQMTVKVPHRRDCPE